MPVMDRIAVLYRAGEIKRLHTVYTQHTHTVAEHVYGSQIIAMELCLLNGLTASSMMRVVGTLLVHDAPEVWTGDWPAPIKREVPELKSIEAQLERQFYAKHNIELPSIIPIEEAIVKAADTLDLAMVCMREKLMGNKSRALEEVFTNCMEYVVAQSWVEGVQFIADQIKEAWNAC